MAAKADLWGEIKTPGEVRTPLAILKEQAALLGEKTENVLRGEVHTLARGEGVHHSFSIVVPALDDYTYELFTIGHSTVDLYPVTTDGGEQIPNESGFVDWLRDRLSSPKTRKIIGNLLAQANS